MTDFPNPLDVRIDFAYGADPNVTPSSEQWTEVPPDHWIAQSLSIPRGRQNEQDQLQSSSWSFQILNDSGDYTPDRAISPHYPHMKLGLPCRLRVGNMVRAIGNVAEITPNWPAGDIESATDPGHSLVTVTVAGMLRRLQQGEPSLGSALARWVPRQEHVVAYWTMEDEGGSMAAGIPGVRPITVRRGSGQVSYASVDKHGSKPLATFSEGTYFSGRVPTFTPVGNGWRVDWLYRMDEVPTVERSALRVLTSSSAAAEWRIRSSDSLFLVEVIDAGGSVAHTASQSVSGEFYGSWLHMTLRVVLSGSSVNYEVIARNLDTVDLRPSEINHLGPSAIGGSGQSVGHVVKVELGQMGAPDRSVGHITVSNTHNLVTADPFRLLAANGFPHEPAAERIERICMEERVPITIIGTAADSMRMGPQPAATFTEVIQDAGDADHGIISERRDAFGLEYRTRVSMQNQPLAIELDAATFPGEITHPFVPTLDDQRTRNDWTMSRPGGSSARFVNEQHVHDHGRYDDSGSVNVPADRPLRHIAAWRVGHGTQPGMRYPSISPALTQVPDLIDEWDEVRLGDLIRITGLPSQHPAGVVDLIMQGYTETLEPHGWHVEVNATPAAPWSNIFTMNHADLGRLGFHAYLAADVGAGDTSFDVVVPVRRALNTNPGFEGDLHALETSDVGLFTGYDWVYRNATFVRSTEQAFRGLASGKITPSGAGIASIRGSVFPAARNMPYVATAWVFAPTGGFDVAMWISLFTGSSGGSAAHFKGTPVTVPTGQWIRIRHAVTSLASTTFVACRVQHEDSPTPSAQVLFVDDGETGVQGKALADETPVDMMIGGEQVTVGSIGSMTNGIQTFSSVTRAQNGVTKGHPAGTDVVLYPLPRLGLGN